MLHMMTVPNFYYKINSQQFSGVEGDWCEQKTTLASDSIPISIRFYCGNIALYRNSYGAKHITSRPVSNSKMFPLK